MTGSVKGHLHNLARAALLGRYPILLQASVETVSGGGTTLQTPLWPQCSLAICMGTCLSSSLTF